MFQRILDFFGHAICHQLDERSLRSAGEVLAVCARDSGIYIGIFSSLFYLFLFKRKKNIKIPSVKASFLLLMLLLPLIIDGLGSYTHLFETNNTRRLITGLLFGLTLPYFLYPLLFAKVLENDSEPVITQYRDICFPFLISIILGGLFLSGLPSSFILDSFIIITLIAWFSMCASFFFTFIGNKRLQMLFSLLVSVTFLSGLSLLHTWVVTLTN